VELRVLLGDPLTEGLLGAGVVGDGPVHRGGFPRRVRRGVEAGDALLVASVALLGAGGHRGLAHLGEPGRDGVDVRHPVLGGSEDRGVRAVLHGLPGVRGCTPGGHPCVGTLAVPGRPVLLGLLGELGVFLAGGARQPQSQAARVVGQSQVAQILIGGRGDLGGLLLPGLLGTGEGQVLVGPVQHRVDRRDLDLPRCGPVGGGVLDLLQQRGCGLVGGGRVPVRPAGVDGPGGDEPGQLLVGVAAVRALVPGPRPGQLPLLPHVLQALPLLVGQPVLTRGGFFLPLLDMPW
jgi:hypothetical protein